MLLCSHALFHDRFMSLSSGRCMVAFPDDYKLLVPRLLIETMVATSASFAARIDISAEEATAEDRASLGGRFRSVLHCVNC